MPRPPKSAEKAPSKDSKKPPALETSDDAGSEKLIPPEGCVAVRMYRIGHGDCFLLAFPGESKDHPSYVLIDCGYKPGSPKHLKTSVEEITADIRKATGGHIHVAVITHEHQDHVNGITANNFKDITIGESWFAWTEDPADDVASDLRRKFKDKLLGLIAARNRLALGGDVEKAKAKDIDEFLAFEFGGDEETFNAGMAEAMLGAAGGGSMNKKSMKLFKDLAANGVKYIKPHKGILSVPGAKDVRVFALGPPRDEEALRSLDPEGGEEFHLAVSGSSIGSFFTAAAVGGGPEAATAPFEHRYCIPWAEGMQFSAEGLQCSVDGWREAEGLQQAIAGPRPQPPSVAPGEGRFFRLFYGDDKSSEYCPKRDHDDNPDEVPWNPPWRRIDKDWLFSAEQLALDMNSQTNNASLVLAFELGKGGKGGKVLLFAADAQRGNWKSWSRSNWTDGKDKITARDLLQRTVLYKVGHHGSHNATLNGKAGDNYPNLAWIAEGDYGREFAAMITAVRSWAETQKGWDHPLKAIKDALLKKASGRVFQTDTDVDKMQCPEGSTADWKAFQSRTQGTRLYFEYMISV